MSGIFVIIKVAPVSRLSLPTLRSYGLDTGALSSRIPPRIKSALRGHHAYSQ